MTVTLKQFQRIGVKQIWKSYRGRVLIADEMGLGKTIQSLYWAVHKAPDCRPIVVVCPAFLKWNWEHEARSKFGLRVQVLEGRKVPHGKPMTKSQLIIINYDILEQWLPYLKRLRPQIVIIDEVHYIKTRRTKKGGAKRTGFVEELCKGVPYIMALGGTPLESRPAELFPILHILKPKRFPSFYSFAARYCQPRRRPWGWEYKGASRTAELHEVLKRECMIRRLVVDVLDELPEMTKCMVKVDIKDRKLYDTAQNNFTLFLKKHEKALGYGTSGKAKGKDKEKFKLRAQALKQMGYLKHLAADLKVDKIIQWIDNFMEANPDEKLIVFAIHKSVMRRLKEHYGNKCVMINGDTPKARRRQYVDVFTKRKDVPLLFGQIVSTGTGWNGTVARNVLVAEFPWVPAQISQAIKRIHRITQEFKTFAHYMVAKGTIEEKLCALLDKKQQILDAILDGRRVEDFSLMNELMKGYANGPVKKAA